jgi:general secretion pathway protein N
VTLLLATLAGWAVALLALALLGMGGRYMVAADNPRLAPALPQFALTKINSRLGPLSDYQEVANRPLMMPERRPVAISAGPGADTAGFDVQLTSVLITPKLQMAILTDNQGGASRRVRVGETVAGTSWRLVELEPRRAVFESPAGQRSLDLRVFSGSPMPVTPLAEGTPSGEAAAAPSPPAPTAESSIRPQAVATEDASSPPVPPPTVESAPAQTQEQQIEAIRKRIEARRAQARAEQAQEKPGQK